MLKRRLAVLGLGALLALALAEGVARALPLDPGDVFFAEPTPPWPGLMLPTNRGAPTPGYVHERVGPGDRVVLRIDAHGVRGAPGPAAWLALGDSFTMAGQLDEEQTFVARLTQATGREGWNAGVDGYSTRDAVRRYRELARHLPAGGLVLLTYYLGNDLTDGTEPPPSGPPAAPPPPPWWSQGWSAALYRNSAAWARLLVALRLGSDRESVPEVVAPLRPFAADGAATLAALLPAAREALADLQAATAANQHRLVVAIAPTAMAFDPDLARRTLAAAGLGAPDVDAPRRAVRDVLAGLHIDTCDLTPALADAAAAGARPYLRYDRHWSPRGHAVVAEALARCPPVAAALGAPR